MNLQETKEHTAKERIKAYIYFGIDAEMDRIENDIEANVHNGDDKDYHARQDRIFSEKIRYANKRIEDLQVYLGIDNA